MTAAPTARQPGPPTPAHPERAAVPRRRPPRRRLPWLLTAAVVVVTVALALLVAVGTQGANRLPGGPYDTASQGHGALGALLVEEDIDVDETRRGSTVGAAAGPDTTVLIDDRDGWLDAWSFRSLLDRGPGRVVLLGPDRTMVRQLELPVTVVRASSVITAPRMIVEPGCDDPAAGRAGTILLPPDAGLYTATDDAVGATGCYAAGSDGAAMVTLRMRGVEVVLIPRIGANRTLADEGNASLAMQVAGAHPRLLWWQPELGSEVDDRIDPRELDEILGPSLLPPGWIHAAFLAVVAVAAVAVWRGRRLGPIITERLPVVVPASETVEGHGRLYARLGARDRAATALRGAARRRLSRLLGHADDTDALVDALAARTGRDPRTLVRLLAGPAPADDTELVQLKRDLDRLEQEARRP